MIPGLPLQVRSLDGRMGELRLGLTECINHGLLHPYPVLHEKPGEIVAQAKATVLLMPNGSDRITPAQPLNVKSEKQVLLLPYMYSSWISVSCSLILTTTRCIEGRRGCRVRSACRAYVPHGSRLHAWLGMRPYMTLRHAAVCDCCGLQSSGSWCGPIALHDIAAPCICIFFHRCLITLQSRWLSAVRTHDGGAQIEDADVRKVLSSSIKYKKKPKKNRKKPAAAAPDAADENESAQTTA